MFKPNLYLLDLTSNFINNAGIFNLVENLFKVDK